MININGQIYMIGMYEGMVVEDDDPLDMCRVKVRVYALHDDDLPVKELPWAIPCHNISGNDSGEKKIPNKGKDIWVSFNQGNPAHPIWIGNSLEVGDARSGNKGERIDGNVDILITGDDNIEIQGNQDIEVNEKQRIEVHGTATQIYQEMGTVVLGSREYTYGKEEGEVQGSSDITIQGQSILKVLGSRVLSVIDSLKVAIGGDEYKYVMSRHELNAKEIEMEAQTFISLNATTDFSVKGVRILLNTDALPLVSAAICTQPHVHTYVSPSGPSVTGSAQNSVIPPLGGIASSIIGPVT